MSTAAQFDIAALLEQAGARPRGNRHDCPKCGSVRTISHADAVFYCHKCGWKGNAFTLAKELGLTRRLSTAEYRKLRQERERAAFAARVLYVRVRARRFELLDQLHSLNQIERVAREAGMGHPAMWDALALACSKRPGLLAELTILENCSAADLIRFLSADPEVRERIIDAVLMAGGLYDTRARFVEVLL